MFLYSLICCLPVKMMHGSYSEWKAKRDLQRRSGTKPASVRSVTSRVKTSQGQQEYTSDGVYTFNQMQRAEREKKGRPASEVGSVRSVQSVMTVEEQVNTLERKVDQLEETLTSHEILLRKILERLPEPSSSPKKGKEPVSNA